MRSSTRRTSGPSRPSPRLWRAKRRERTPGIHAPRSALQLRGARPAENGGRGRRCGIYLQGLERESSALGAALAEAGVARGDRVGVYMDKSWEAIVAMLAASRIGAAYVNVNPLFKPPQVAYLAQDCDLRVVIGDSSRLEALEAGTVPGTAFYKGDPPREEIAKELVDLAEVLGGGAVP